MNVFFEAPNSSRGLKRIESGLRRFLPPNFREVRSKEQADLVVLQLIGRHDQNEILVNDLVSRGKQVVLIQVSLRSTRNKDAGDWLPLWKKAKFVWSYYDLPAMLREDGRFGSFEFHHAPLGVNPEFKPHDNPKEYVAMTIGSTLDAEGYLEVWKAAELVGKQAAHLGDLYGHHSNLTYFPRNCSDVRLAGYYSQCDHVAALRRKDGFELPAAEALLCGTRPILYDRPHFRSWYDGLAIFIPENSPSGVVKSLANIFRKKPDPVSKKELEEARSRFDWSKIAKDFWSRCNA